MYEGMLEEFGRDRKARSDEEANRRILIEKRMGELVEETRRLTQFHCDNTQGNIVHAKERRRTRLNTFSYPFSRASSDSKGIQGQGT